MTIVQDIFGESGVLSEILEGYIPREGQLQMAEKVYACLHGERHGIIEAPTGTGKTLAAGLPASVWAAQTGSAVVYATANKTLQDQLYFKDLPTIQKVIQKISDADEAEDWQYGIIKGMSNYLCLQMMEEAKNDETIDEVNLALLKDFVSSTNTGDRSDILNDPGDHIWSMVSTGPDGCYKKECPHFDDCFAYKARNRVFDCHFVVTNYHILFLDRELRRLSNGMVSLLPPHKVVIMDEVHEVPEIAMDFRGYSFSSYATAKIKGVLTRAAQGGSGTAKALASRLESCGRQLQGELAERARGGSILEDVLGDDFGLISALEDSGKYLLHESKEMKKSGGDDSNIARLTQMADKCNSLAHRVGSFCYGEVEHVRKEVDPLDGTEREIKYKVVGDSKTIGEFPENHVFYLDFDRKRKAYNLNCKVIDAGRWLKDNIFEHKTVIATSATIATAGKLSFIGDQLGLEEDEYEGEIVSSPFDSQRVLAVIPEKAPDPQSNVFSTYVAENIIGIVKSIKEGGVMGLFTSYRNLEAAANACKSRLRGTKVLVQGELGKRQIIDEFTKEHLEGRKALILATASFWQGVDIPGKALSVVIIDKIPFSPPDDPVFWYLDRTTDKAFFRHSVPKAMIALKQGVGRLIRRESDYGCVIICDHRMRTKQYGKRMQNALPDGCYVTDDLSHVPLFLEELAEG